MTSYAVASLDAEALARHRASATLVVDEAQALKNAATHRSKALRGLRRGVAPGADRHAAREPPRRAVEPAARRLAGAARELGAVSRSLRRADREVRRRPRASRRWLRCSVRSCCAGPKPRWRPSCRRAPRSCAVVRLSEEEQELYEQLRQSFVAELEDGQARPRSRRERDALRGARGAHAAAPAVLPSAPRVPAHAARLVEGGVPARAAGRAARGRAQRAGVQSVPQLPRAAGAAPAAARLPRAGARRHDPRRSARGADRRLSGGARPTCS